MKVGWDAIRRTDNAGRVPLFYYGVPAGSGYNRHRPAAKGGFTKERERSTGVTLKRISSLSAYFSIREK